MKKMLFDAHLFKNVKVDENMRTGDNMRTRDNILLQGWDCHLQKDILNLKETYRRPLSKRQQIGFQN